MDINTKTLFAALAMALSISACASTQNRGPKLESSAASVTYASIYASRLQELNVRYSEGATFATTVASGFTEYPGKLKSPDWKQVEATYTKADEAGRSTEVAESIRDHTTITKFVDETHGDIAWKVGSHVNNSAAKGGCGACDYDSKGAVKWALKDATTKELEKRLWAFNEAHRLVEDNEATLGKKNIKTLHEQVDEITETSYFVFVDLVEIRAEMERRASEARSVSSTLEDAIDEEKKILDSDAPKARKKAAETRISELQDARTPIEATADETNALLEGSEDRIAAIQKEYRGSLEAMIDAVRKQAKEAGTAK